MLLVVAQLLFLLGITLLIGFKKTLIFFKRPSKLRGTGCFLGGILLVLVGWPVVGMVVEVFGILNLFGNFVSHSRHTSPAGCCRCCCARDRLLTPGVDVTLLSVPNHSQSYAQHSHHRSCAESSHRAEGQ
jgi:hypothetical protein